MNGMERPLILASESDSRRRILENAGVRFSIAKPQVDEEAVKESLLAEGAFAHEIAESLAELKARGISRKSTETFVIGADQVLVASGRIFDKPLTLEVMREQLMSLRGEEHELHTAVYVAREGATIWHHNAVAKMKMRSFSEKFLDWYTGHASPDILRCAGGYQLEGIGAQLFERIEGDYFAILGLPLLPLLGFLREHELVMP